MHQVANDASSASLSMNGYHGTFIVRIEASGIESTLKMMTSVVKQKSQLYYPILLATLVLGFGSYETADHIWLAPARAEAQPEVLELQFVRGFHA